MPNHQRRISRRMLLKMAPSIVVLGASVERTIAASEPDLAATYSKPGPHKVTSTDIDLNGKPTYRVVSPVLPDDSRTFPAVVWGNGTAASPDDYDDLFRHVASWGLIVIAPFSGQTGSGQELSEAACYLVAAGVDTTSQMYSRIDPQRIGLAGHSQGASGAINAATRFSTPVVFRTVVAVALPAPRWSTREEDVYDTSLLDAPFFIFGGTYDQIVSPAISNRDALLALDATVPAGMALARGAGHTEIQGNGGMLRGYFTAWLRSQLADDVEAHAAFGGEDPAIRTDDRFSRVLLRNMDI